LLGMGPFPVEGTVGGQCKDTNFVNITYMEPPIANAGLNANSCEMTYPLDAESTFGGYWSIASSPAGGTNCSATFLNHITGEPDIYDSLAFVTVTCLGDWVFTWHEVNGPCEATDNVTITFISNSIDLNTLPEQRTCYDYTQVNVDTTGYGNDTWRWSINPNWYSQYGSEISVIFNEYDPMTIVYRDFPERVFGDSGYVEIPMIITLITNGCTSIETSSVTFYQKPKPFIGEDTLVCSDQIMFDVTPTIPASVSEVQWYGSNNPNVVSGTYTSIPYDTYATTISASLGDSLNIIISEENILGNNHPSCLVRDSIVVEFLKRPDPNAGLTTIDMCGNCIQLDAHLDNSVNSVGRWLINQEGFFGYSCGDNNPSAVADSNAWFYHSTGINPGVDTVYVHWLEYNAKSAQCYAVDSVPVHFWYEDTAYIKLNGNLSLIDSTCGKRYINISGNDNMPTNQYSKGTWWSADGNPIEWFANGGVAGSEHVSQLDYIEVTSIGGQANVWRDIYWVIENGDIFGSGIAPVCRDTSATVRVRFDNPVVAQIAANPYPEPIINCGDTLRYLSAQSSSIYNWSHYQWRPNDYSYFYDVNYTGNRADTLSNTGLAAPANIYPNDDTIQGGNQYEQVIMDVYNGQCLEHDTINVRWAPIPSGTFNIEQPQCAGTDAILSIRRDMVAGLDKYISVVEWDFSSDIPTQVVANNPTQDTIHVRWDNSASNSNYKHPVSVYVENIWGCHENILPPDTVFESEPAYVEWVDNTYPTCGDCDGVLSFRNFSNEHNHAMNYSVQWASNPDFNNPEDNIIVPDSTYEFKELCFSDYYLRVVYQSSISGGTCNDTLVFDLHQDSSTVAVSNYEFLVDTSDLQAPFKMNNTSINNVSVNANKYTWQVFAGNTEDLAMLIYEGNDEVPDYILSNMGEYLVKLQAFNDKAPNCPTSPIDMTIFVHYESVLEVPNIFTPNNDGYNDEFRVKARELQTYNCVIYNRWGEKVFETTDFEESWNGKKMNNGGDLSAGAYYYVITGTGKKGQEFEFKGAIQLMRDNK